MSRGRKKDFPVGGGVAVARSLLYHNTTLYRGRPLSCLNTYAAGVVAVKRTLGIDLGPNSIGWALIDDDPTNPDRSKIVDLGVRVFPEGVDAFDTSKEASRNEQRRVARGMRRQIKRRARRRRQLREALVAAGLWPKDDPAAESALYKLDPYQLRARALTEELAPHEIGRVLLHLNQRRGFLSNRKRDRADEEVKGMLDEINQNEAERIAGGYATVGAWLAEKCPRAGKEAREYHTNRKENDHIRNRHLARSQYENEFEAIWQSLAKYYPDLLTDEMGYGKLGRQKDIRDPMPRHQKYLNQEKTVLNPRFGMSDFEAFGLFGLIFFQRPMYWPKSVVGLCDLEPKQKRCPKSDRRYQRFRLLQEVNNLEYIDPDSHLECKLSDGQRRLLLEKLSRTKEMTFDQIRKALGFLETVKFNLERGHRTKLHGAPIDALFASKNVLGKKWHDRPEEEKDEIVQCLLDDEQGDERFVEMAVSQWNMTPQEAETALGVDLPAGYGNLSLRALKKLLPHMEKGLLYMADDDSNSALHAAGYVRRDQLQRRIFDKLPDPRRTRDCPIGDIPNPVVKRALTEVRRVVNTIIREHGKPDAVHVEMARSVQQGKKRRDEASKRMRERENERSEAAEKIKELGFRPSRETILKYLLWLQQDRKCMYSGKEISPLKLIGEGGGVEIDHILPRSRTLDDSQMNKVVCLRTANAGKGDRTPHEWLADSDPDSYERLCQRAGSLMREGKIPYAKYRRFIQKELDLNNFINRQLTDTGDICRATAEYLRCLFDQDHDVLGLKGQLTAELRWRWGLENILAELPDSPAWQEQAKMRPGEKNRADHRHHTIDALVVALTNRSRLSKLSEIVKSGSGGIRDEELPKPWQTFRDDVLREIRDIKVSHRVERKVRGKLHDATFYGPTPYEGKWVIRKPLVELSASEIEHIRDEAIGKIVQKAFGMQASISERQRRKQNQKLILSTYKQERKPRTSKSKWRLAILPCRRACRSKRSAFTNKKKRFAPSARACPARHTLNPAPRTTSAYSSGRRTERPNVTPCSSPCWKRSGVSRITSRSYSATP